MPAHRRRCLTSLPAPHLNPTRTQQETADRLFAVHAFTLLQAGRLRALGRMSANLEFDLATWLPSLRCDRPGTGHLTYATPRSAFASPHP